MEMEEKDVIVNSGEEFFFHVPLLFMYGRFKVTLFYGKHFIFLSSLYQYEHAFPGIISLEKL
jgi:hypothetical protein